MSADDAYMEYLMSQNPFEILLNYTTPAGVQQVTFQELDHWLYRQCQGSIIQGIKLGAGIIMILATNMFTRRANKMKPMFWGLQATLFFMCLKSIFYMYYYLSNSGSITFAFSGYYVLDVTNRNMTTVTDLIQVLFVASIQLVLICQVWTLYKIPENGYAKNVLKFVVLGVCIVLAVVNIGFYIVDITFALIEIYNESGETSPIWTFNVPVILFLTSLWFQSFCLIGKLVYCVYLRRQCGMKNFSIYHILFIMSFQSMIIPAMVVIVSYNLNDWTSNTLPEISFFLTAMFLPFSIMWASSRNDSSSPYSTGGFMVNSVSHDDSIYDSEGSLKISDIENIPEEESTISQNYAMYNGEKGIEEQEEDEDEAISPTTLHSRTI
ncbi:alpha-factor pheromone receptor [Saccharomycopsis crataegensis]|uniref:Alpha-factor pheromone receptor n=1 Tax=Saccharomycopsis crataegensis TaxID=43959 RepID=A0AAV5QL00_9ASCO|nr:alpha-factor pheromone receptor [Saccharomycopsis crataegensis]